MCVAVVVVCLCSCLFPLCCNVVVFVVAVVGTVKASRMMKIVMMLVGFVSMNMLVVSNCGGC